MHLSGTKLNSGNAACDSGLWHQMQRRGQPFRKTAVRIPGPSLTEVRFMSRTSPLVISYGFFDQSVDDELTEVL